MSAASGPAITFFSNIPNPYNDRLFAALRHEGARVRAVYKHAPEAEGRHWPTDLHADEVITESPLAEAKAWKAAAGTHVILTGSYATAIDAGRRLMVSRRARSVHVWGERLHQQSGLVQSLRRGYFAPWRLDGILAIGSLARRTYRPVTGTDIPIHTFPYTTDRGLDVPPTPAARPTIGFAGRLLDHKGVDVLIRALALTGAIHGRAPDPPPADQVPMLEIAGAGPERTSLEALARGLGVQARLAWLGELTPDALDRRRAQWWVQVVPTQQSEGWGVVVHEALNSSVPVISSDQVTAACDLVRSDLNGVVLEKGEGTRPDAWAGAITALVEDPARRARLATAARQVGRAFAPPVAAPWLIDLLEQAGRGRAGAGITPMARSFVDDAWAHRAETPDGRG